MEKVAIFGYSMGGIEISVKGRQATRQRAPIIVVAPHSSFLDAIVIHVAHMSSPLARDNDEILGSKFEIFYLSLYTLLNVLVFPSIKFSTKKKRSFSEKITTFCVCVFLFVNDFLKEI